MTAEQVAQIVQVSYPQVYLACHTRHQRKRSTEHRLSQRDSSLLAHLSGTRAMRPSRLADHLGITRSTVSESLKRLRTLGFVELTESSPGRMSGARLTAKGRRAISDTSVLETGLLLAALSAASRDDLRLIADGMERLATLCRTLSRNDQ